MRSSPREIPTLPVAEETAAAASNDRLNAPAAYRYGLAVLAVVIGVAIRSALDSILGPNAPYLLFVLGILLVARHLGRGPALVATSLSTVSIQWFFLEPRHSFRITSSSAALGLVLFIAVGVLTSLLLAHTRSSLLALTRSERLLRRRAELLNLSPQLINSANRVVAEWDADTADSRIAGAGRVNRKPHLFWLTATLLAVLIESGLFAATWRSFSQNERLSFHAHEVVEQTDSLVLAVQDGDRAQHEYLLTRKDLYLASLNDTLPAIPDDLAKLAKLTANDPAQPQVDALTSPVSEKLAALQRNSRRPVPAIPGVLASSEQLTRQIRTSADALRAKQLLLLKHGTERMLVAKRLMISLLSAGSAVLLLLLLVGSRQIDENIRARQKAEEVRSGLAAIVNSSEDAIVGISLDGGIASWNPAAEKLYGYTAAEILGQPISLLMPAESQRETKQALLDRIGQGKSLQHEETVRVNKEGHRIDVLISTSPIRNRRGELTGASAFVRDRTERKQAEQKLRDSEEQFRTLANAIPQLCWMANPDGWIFWYNQRWFEYTGTTAEQMEGWQWKSVHDPEILPQVLERWKASIESGQSFDMTFPLRGADKVYRPFLTRVVPVRDYQGKLTRWFGTNTDISEQSRAEDELRQRESQLRTLGDNLPEGALYRYRLDLNNEAHMEFISAGIERMTGVPAAEFIADTATAISNILSEDMGRLNAAIATSREQLTRFEVEVRHKHRRTGEVHWSLMRSTPSRRPDGSTVWDGIELDITDRKLAENEVLRLNASLEARVRERTAQLLESNRELEAFSYSVSHDLRAPLRSIEGFAKILLRDYTGKQLDATAANYMHRMSDASQRMGNLIADLLTLSRLTRIEMSRKDVDLSEFARDILADCQSREPNRSVSTAVQAGLVTDADPILMRVALENLLGNAWKYTSKTDAAHIAFEAGVQQKELIFCIRDNGAGFDMAHSDQLFAPFQRLHRSDEFEGNGIGLATVQRVIRRHGGRIWAESKPGEGAVFYFTLGEA